ncbi:MULTISPECIES: NUDIX domain-containing protein [unclassified Methanosarcina]|uniref:NUDIX domain-containing protein n=1 Tax=unclassified Methanosarcina TaxID=2644672 RepID=UPI000615B3CC|nr:MULTISPECIES: NUDIX domain-containing protein [unclassified Methanosarcina]AKB18139.1 MuT/NUDIX protein [Methanosarcina sp. WWM596]AKB21471.1 MuT/NUDIX protein [Methanosarcina sp. WH1]
MQEISGEYNPFKGVTRIPSAYDNRRGSVIVDTDKGVLLVSSSGSYYRLPGGKPKRGEASIQAAIRELREETGLRAYEVKYLFKFHASKIFWIKAKGKPTPGNEIHHFAFFKPGKDMEVKVSDNTLKILKIYYELNSLS